MKAYIQGDWVGSAVSGTPEEAITKKYNDFRNVLYLYDILDVATWTTNAVGVVGHPVDFLPAGSGVSKRIDVLRNKREIDGSDVVITY